jgi:hypothetical protein
MQVPMTFKCEEFLPGFRFHGSAVLRQGSIRSFDDTDPTDNQCIFQTGQEWYVLVRWAQWGELCHMFDDGCVWSLRLYLEKMGIGEFELMSEDLTLSYKRKRATALDPVCYKMHLPQPQQSIAVPEGLYKVSFSMTFKDPERKPCPVAAFADGPLCQWYDPR